MCGSSYSGPSGTGFAAFIKDAVGKGKKPGGGGVSTGGYSGPSATSAMATQFIGRKAGAPLLDDKFGVQ